MKEEKMLRSQWLHIRMTVQEMKLLKKDFEQATDRSMSGFARKKILGKPLRILTRDHSKDQVAEQLAALKTELSRLASNYNQVVKKLHAIGRIKDFEHWLVSHELDRRKLLAQVDKASALIEKIAEQW